MVSNEVHTRTSIVRLDTNGIIRLTILPGANETLADAQASFRAVVTLGAGKRPPMLVDMRSMKSQGRDARQFYGSSEVDPAARAIALLTESRVSMLVANFFIGVTKTKMPTRIFTNEAEALAWLQGFLL